MEDKKPERPDFSLEKYIEAHDHKFNESKEPEDDEKVNVGDWILHHLR